MQLKPLIWLTGNVCDLSLAPAAAWLGEVASTQIVEPDRAVIAAGRFPAAIVVFQSRPGQVSQQRVAQLQELAPFAQVVWILGPWCEGQRRLEITGQESPRIYWHEWPARLPRELGITTSAKERAPLAGTAAISTDSRDSFFALADALKVAGLASVWHGREPPPADEPGLLLIDGWQACPAELISAQAPALLLLDWPRPEDIERAARLGISRVLARPLRIADLHFTLKSLRRGAEQAAAAQAVA